MGSKVEARASHRFRATAQQVYDAWLDPEQVRQWLAAALQSLGLAGDVRRVEIDPHVGGRFLLSDMRRGTEAQHWGNYLELDRPHKIVFTWIVDASDEEDPSKVTLTIREEGNGCTTSIVHEMDEAWAEYIPQTERGWTAMLQQIDVLVG